MMIGKQAVRVGAAVAARAVSSENSSPRNVARGGTWKGGTWGFAVALAVPNGAQQHMAIAASRHVATAF
jgi:hypothetical protein